MESTNIKTLLKKYEDARTTLEEEAFLRAYFTSENSVPNLGEYQMMFAYFKSSKEDTYSKSVENTTHSKRKHKWFSIAATVLIFLCLYFVGEKLNQLEQEKEARKTLAQVTEGLKMVSASLKKGNQAFSMLYVYEESINKISNN